jgi:hypothetical protein
MKLKLISRATFKAILLINGLAYSQPTIPCAGEDYASLEKNKEYYELLFAESFFLDDNWLPNLNLEYEAFSWNFQGNTYKLPSAPTTITAAMCQSAFGSLENGARLIESLLVMYETTHDKAYLHWAMDLSVHWISMRGIGPNSPSSFAWNNGSSDLGPGEGTYSPHNPSLIIWAMAHLCHVILIEEQSTLCTQNFNRLLLEKYGNALATLPQDTYGYYADWLVHRLVESMDFLISNFWLGSTIGFRDEDGGPGAINQQSSFGAALFYLGHLSNTTPCFGNSTTYSGLQSYLDKAANIATLFTEPFLVCDFILGGSAITCLPYTCESQTPFVYRLATDSYWWYVDGYAIPRESCLTIDVVDREEWENFSFNPSQDGVRFFEDISHGVRTMYFPLVCEKNNFSTQGYHFFDPSDMEKFANTFKNVIWNPNQNKCYPNVRGVGYEHFTKSTAGCETSFCQIGDPVLAWDAIAWASLHRYDNTSNHSLYNSTKQILGQQLQIAGPGSWINGGRVHGLSHVTNAQWAYDCVDVTIYNRKLNYNQDLFAPHDLTIHPTAEDCYHQLGMNSFAAPIIQSDNFTVEPNVTANISAGNKIVIKGEVHFKAGSEVRLFIDPALNNCFSGGRYANSTVAESNQTSILSMNQQRILEEQNNLSASISPSTDTSPTLKFDVQFSPNPVEEICTLTLSLPQASNIIIQLFDINGRLIKTESSKQLKGQSNYPLNFSELNSGLYLLKVITEDGEKAFKVSKT